MKRSSFVLAAAVAILSASCDGCRRTTPPPPRAAAPAPVAGSGSPAAALAINDSAASIIAPGTPIVVSLTMTIPPEGEESPAPIVMAHPSGRWSGAVRIVDGDRKPLPLLLRLVTGAKASISLDRDTYGQLTWVADPATTSALAPGDYQFLALVEAGGVKATSNVATLTVRPGAEGRDIAVADYLAADGKTAEAVSALNALLEREPNHAGALERKGDLLAGSDKVAALEAYEAALASIPRVADEHPPFALTRKRNALVVGGQ